MYWNNLLHYSHTPSYFRRISLKTTGGQQKILKSGDFLISHILAVCKSRCFTKEIFMCLFRQCMLESNTMPAITQTTMTWTRSTSKSQSGDQFNPEHIGRLNPVNTCHPKKLLHFPLLIILPFKKGQSPPPILCTKKEHKSPGECRREGLPCGPVGNISF